MIWRSLTILSYILMLVLCQCVGPTSPFGAVESLDKTPQRSLAQEIEADQKFQIKFHPQRQVLHDRSDFSIEITSDQPISEQVQLQLFHNGFDVTKGFLKNTYLHRSEDGKTLIYSMKDMRLKILDPNKIEARLKTGLRSMASQNFSAPDCSLFENRSLAHLGAFHAPENYIDLIERVARQKNTNPSFLAGIVAQESGFNPKAVSWAKAIGLTQMTPLAEEQVLKSVDGWPRYPGINQLSYLTLKSKIYLGEIDDNKEWRLNPEQSLEGGMAYVRYLRKYWSLEQNRQLVENLGGNTDKQLTEVILASYNSGAARVKKALIQNKKAWKHHKSLREAAKYIKKVSSYCFHYAKSEVNDDNET